MHNIKTKIVTCAAAAAVEQMSEVCVGGTLCAVRIISCPACLSPAYVVCLIRSGGSTDQAAAL